VAVYSLQFTVYSLQFTGIARTSGREELPNGASYRQQCVGRGQHWGGSVLWVPRRVVTTGGLLTTRRLVRFGAQHEEAASAAPQLLSACL
jgi:hypothetical protein